MAANPSRLLTLGVLALTGCTGGLADSPPPSESSATKADDPVPGALPDLLILNEVLRIPAADAPSTPTFSKTCLLFDNEAFEEAQGQAEDALKLVVTDDLIVHSDLDLDRHALPSALATAQLRETLRYHIVDDELLLEIMNHHLDPPAESVDAFETMHIDDLNAMAEGARYGWVYDKVGLKSYDLINIGLGGGNSFELLFEHGTLKPVAATQDGDLTHCDEDLLRDP